jgi:hypothetical protein
MNGWKKQLNLTADVRLTDLQRANTCDQLGAGGRFQQIKI